MGKLISTFGICIYIMLIGVMLMSCKSIENKTYDKGAVTSVSEFEIPDSDIPRMKIEAMKGSAQDAFKLYQFYDFVQRQFKEGYYWLIIAAENGHTIAQINLGKRLIDDPDPQNRRRAFFWIKQAADKGNVEALKILKSLE